MRTIILLIISLFLWSIAVFSQEPIQDNQAIRAIIGESANQGYQGMLVISMAIRNRGSLEGVYGLNSPIVDKQPRWVWQMAGKAWKESANKDFTNGATHWESTDFPVPGWAYKMKEVYRYKKHIFYKVNK